MSGTGLDQKLRHATNGREYAGFTRASELGPAGQLAVREGELHDQEAPIAPSEYVIAPVMNLAQAKQLWNTFLELKGFLLEDPACYDEIAGSREMNRTGATRLATAFGLSIETVRVDEGRVQEDESNEYDYRFIVRQRVSRGARYADGIASCRLSEIPATTKKGEKVPYSQREHFALTKAATRATKRAISDLLGGAEPE